MNKKLLQDAGVALYGAHWQPELSRDLRVSERTVRRWVSGADDPPPGIAADLLRICQERGQEINDLCSRLKAAVPDR